MDSLVFKLGDTVRSVGEGAPLSLDGADHNLTGVVIRVRTAAEVQDSDDWIGVRWSKELKWPSTVLEGHSNKFTRWHYPKYLIHVSGFDAQVMEYVCKELHSCISK